MIKLMTAATAAAALALTPAMAADHHAKKKSAEMAEMKSDTIADKAMATDALSTLVSAVKAAGLVDVLKSDGPFTVFAPTNDAFDAISDTVATLNEDQLGTVLKAHVVATDLSAADLIMLTAANDGMVRLATVSGATLVVQVTDGNVTVTDENGGVATVAMADVDASNGTVHVIDAVLVPAL